MLPIPCQEHRLVGYASQCQSCRLLAGWILIEPITRQWTFVDPDSNQSLSVKRSQLPIMPAEACPLYSLQGATCDPGLIAHFVMPRRADDDIKWLIVYVMLSRVRSLSSLKSTHLNDKIRDIIVLIRYVTIREAACRRSCSFPFTLAAGTGFCSNAGNITRM